jgi:YVTN family beta-propeller protein
MIHKGGVVKSFLTLFAVCCLVSASLGQRLAAEIYLPDSLCGLTGPTCLAYNSSNQTLYVAGDGSNVIAIAGATSEKVARIDVGARVNALCCDPVSNKVYVALYRDTVVVIDAASNTVSTRIPAGYNPSVFFYDSAFGKLYCANSGGNNVTVIDAARDSVVATITTGWGAAALCSDPTGAKVYCALSEDGAVAVLDAQADTLLSKVQVGAGVCALYCNSQRNKVYCANHGDRSVSVISTTDDSVVATVTTAEYPRAFGYDPTRDRLYCACEQREVTVVDCAQDTVLAHVAVSNKPWDVLYDSASDRVYCVNYLNQVVVIDAAADTVVKALTLPPRPCALALNADHDYVYCVSTTGNAVTVIDASQDTIAATVATGCNLDFTVFSEKSGKLYVGCSSGAGGHLAVIDGTSNVVERYISIPDYGPNMCYDSSLDNVFVGGGGDTILTAIACAEDSIVATVKVPGGGTGQTCCNPVDNKVYSTTGQGGTLTVIGAAADSVITTLHFPSPNGPWEMCYFYGKSMVYVHMEFSDSGSVYAIDGRGDTVVADMPTYSGAGGAMLVNRSTSILYDADELNSYVALIDCNHNQYLGSLLAGGQPTAMCCDTKDNRIFVATLQGFYVWVFSGHVPPTVDSIEIDQMMGDILYNPLSNRVYCAAGNVYVIDGAAKVVLDSFQAGMSIGVGQPAFALNALANRVYALDAGNSRVLVIQDSVTVGTREGGGVNATRDAARLACAPNPFTRSVHVSFMVPAAGSIRAQVFDVSGRRVAVLADGPAKAGKVDTDWTPHNLANGVYMLKVELPNGSRTEKLMMLR